MHRVLRDAGARLSGDHELGHVDGRRPQVQRVWTGSDERIGEGRKAHHVHAHQQGPRGIHRHRQRTLVIGLRRGRSAALLPGDACERKGGPVLSHR
ncbi:MAG: hypothetical protein IPM49_08680 [Flavobacteriales bacterium]|nr:hypothetical protein [Flavobacteriales bacterium]